MNELFILSFLAIIMSFAALLSYVLGYVLTETELKLRFNIKPFTCRPCMTFWITILLFVVIAYLFTPQLIESGIINRPMSSYVAIIGLGILIGLNIFQYIKLKFKTYE